MPEQATVGLLGCSAGGRQTEVETEEPFAVSAECAGEVDEQCLRPGPGQTGNVTPVSSSETVHRRSWMAVSWDRPLEWASFG